MTLTANIKLVEGEFGSNDSFFREYIGFSHFQHDFAVLFLNSQVRKKTGKKFIQTLSGYISFVNCSAIKVLSFFRDNFFPIVNAQKFMKPFHNGLINRGKLKNSSMHNRINTCFSFDGVDIKTSIAINVSREISKVKLFHNYSFTTVYTDIEYKSTVND